MGASCTKGSKTTDPDRTPYGNPKKSQSKQRQNEAHVNADVVREVERPMSGNRKSEKPVGKAEAKGTVDDDNRVINSLHPFHLHCPVSL